MDVTGQGVDSADDNITITTMTPTICSSHIPTFHEYIMSLSTDFVITFGVMGFLTVALILNYLEEILYLYRNSSRWQSRDKAKWLLAVYPLTAFTSLVALIAPRTAGLNELVASMYVSVCVYVFIIMLVDQYGGPQVMFKQLRGRDFVYYPFPFCCCFCCPRCKTNKVHLQIVHAMVLQFVLVRPCLGYVLALMWTDGTYGDTEDAEESPQTYIMFTYSLSTLIAIYAFAVVKQQSVKLLSVMHVRPKYFCLQAVLLVVGLQRSVILTVFLSFQLPCEPPLHIESTVDRYNNMLIICEMSVLAIIARIYYRETAQAYIGQMTSKYRRQTTHHLRSVFSKATQRQGSREPPSTHETTIIVEQPISKPGDGAASDDPLMFYETETHLTSTNVNVAVDADSGCSSLEDNDIISRF